MRPRPLPCLLVTLAFLCASCTSLRTTTRLHRVEVTSDPAGATVWQEQGLRGQELGTTPVKTWVEERETREAFNHAWWLFPAVGLGFATWGFVSLAKQEQQHYPDTGPGYIFQTIIGLSVGLPVLIGSLIPCIVGEVRHDRLHAREYVGGAFTASAPGHGTGLRAWRPGPGSSADRLHFTLPRLPGGGDAFVPVRPRLLVPPVEVDGLRLSLEKTEALREHVRQRLIAWADAPVAPLDTVSAIPGLPTRTLRTSVDPSAGACTVRMAVETPRVAHADRQLQERGACRRTELRASADRLLRRLLRCERVSCPEQPIPEPLRQDDDTDLEFAW